jgi:putative transposase
VQRGNDRQRCFFEEADYLRYLQELKELVLRRHCAVHAYVLMTNHAHLLLTPSGVGQVAALMQALGRRYVRYINDRHHRTGTLWEGRYKSCLVDRESRRPLASVQPSKRSWGVVSVRAKIGRPRKHTEIAL